MRLVAILALWAMPAFAGPPAAVLTWGAPTTNTDSTPITAPLTYNVYQGLTGSLVKVQSGLTSTAFTVTTGLTLGTTQCFAVTAVANGQESAPSPSVCAPVAFPTPGQPNQVVVVVR